MQKACMFSALLLVLVVSLFVGCQRPDLVVYSPHREDFIDLVVDMYESETGKNLEVITAGTGELIARIKTEAANPNADVIWGGATSTLLPESEYFEVYRSPRESSVVPAFRNVEGTVTRINAISSTIVVNTRELAEICGPNAKITGYQSIIDLAQSCPDLRGRVSNADPSKSSSSFEQLINQIWAFSYIVAWEEMEGAARMFSLMSGVLGALGGGEMENPVKVDDITQEHINKAWDDVARLIDVYDGKHAAGSGAVITDVVQGETAIGLSHEQASAIAADGSDDVILVYPVEGTVLKGDGAAIIKGAKRMEEAKAFIDYLLSDKVQNSIKSVYRRAVITDADFTGSPLAPFGSFLIIQDNPELNDKAEFLRKYAELF